MKKTIAMLALSALTLAAAGCPKKKDKPAGGGGAVTDGGAASAGGDGGSAAAPSGPTGLAGPGGAPVAGAKVEEAKSSVVGDVLAVEQAENAALGENKPAITSKAVSGLEDNVDKGDFKLVVGESAHEVRTQLAAMLGKFLEHMNTIINLPRDIPVLLGGCGGETDAHYDPNAVHIKICDEFLDLFENVFASYKEDPAEIRRALLGSLLFVFLHEMGHALIDQLELPATGREEDAVDQMATLILIGGGPETQKVALDGAEAWLALQVMRPDHGRDRYWDEHSLDEQRFYNIICLIFGSDPAANMALVEEGDLPKERAVRCKGEFTSNNKAWDRLLAPAMKK